MKDAEGRWFDVEVRLYCTFLLYQTHHHTFSDPKLSNRIIKPRIKLNHNISNLECPQLLPCQLHVQFTLELSLLVEANVVCHKCNMKQLCFSKLYLGYVFLCHLLIYILEASFHFNLTFLHLNVIKMFTVL